jgi:hypothetical protein
MGTVMVSQWEGHFTGCILKPRNRRGFPVKPGPRRQVFVGAVEEKPLLEKEHGCSAFRSTWSKGISMCTGIRAFCS